MRFNIISILFLVSPIQIFSNQINGFYKILNQTINTVPMFNSLMDFSYFAVLYVQSFWLNLGLPILAGIIILLVIILFIYRRTTNLKKLGKLVDQKTKELQEKNYENTKINEALDAEKEYLKVTLEAIGDGVIAVDSEGEILFVNKAAENLFEIQEFEVIGESIEDLLKEMVENNDAEKISPFIISPIDSYNTVKRKQIIVNTADNKRKILLVGSSIIQQDNQKGVVFTFKDKTALISIENQLSLSQKMESVGHLAAGIAHEINTPLQFVGDNREFLSQAFSSLNQYVAYVRELSEKNINSSEELKRIKEKEKELDVDFLLNEIPEALEQSLTGIKRVSSIVLSMKNFAHPGTKDKSSYDINKGIEVTINISRNKWKYVADLETKLAPDLPPLYCSLDEINQVILNLILNGADAIEDKINDSKYDKGLIKIETEHVNDIIEIKISDNGMGIPTDNHQKIFNPFFTTKEVGKGTGQGLAICHDIIVKNHNGEIFLDSIPGEGTTFTIKLPIPNSNQLIS